MVSSLKSLQYLQENCDQLLSLGLPSGVKPQPPTVDKINREYGGWDLRPSNVFSTGTAQTP